MSDVPLTAFKAYDIRGRIPDQLNADIAHRIGRAYVDVIKPRSVVVGHDIRLSSADLVDALVDGLTACGVNVMLLGLCGTEEVYFSTSHLKADGGIMVTASHNPADYNGMKLVRKHSIPISGDTGLKQIAQQLRVTDRKAGGGRGTVEQVTTRPAYIDHLLGYVNKDRLKPLKILSNPGNGCAGPVVEALEPHLPMTFTRIQHEPDGTFPHGIPNPLLPENRGETTEAVRRSGADFGIAWDGDFDRCFFFDERGRFIEGYYIVGLLAQQTLSKATTSQSTKAAKIIYDPRLTWNTIDLVNGLGGQPVLCKSGHAFIKERYAR